MLFVDYVGVKSIVQLDKVLLLVGFGISLILFAR